MNKALVERARAIELKLDDLERAVVPLLGQRIEQVRYWRNAQIIGRGRLLELYMDTRRGK